MSDQILLSVKHLKKTFTKERTFLRIVTGHVKAIDDISFDLHQGETLALVGESGCGKTTTGRCIVRSEQPTDGSILYYDSRGTAHDVTKMGSEELRWLRQNIRMVFQDPFSSLNPRMTIEQIVGEPIKINERISNRSALRERVAAVLQKVQVDENYMTRYPHAFSGGQRQRIALARALAIQPNILIADEPVSALDVSIQAQILNLMKRLQREEDLSYIFIAHDLGVVRYQSDRVAVMYLGRIAEIGERSQIFENPKHPYTELLLACCPAPNPRVDRSSRRELLGDRMVVLEEEEHADRGCRFSDRCVYAQERCRNIEPELEETEEPGHRVACHRSKELALRTFSSFM